MNDIMKKFIIFCFVFGSVLFSKMYGQEDPINCQYPFEVTLYLDNDKDGKGDPATVFTEIICTYVARPGVVTQAGDCNDNDETIQTPVTWYRDQDGDTYGSYTVTTTSCTQPSGYIRRSGDCDDTNVNIFNERTWFIDEDNDGKGKRGNNGVKSCYKPAGNYVLNNDDCNDNDASNWQNSNWYVDADGDGYGEGSVVVSPNCEPPTDGNTYVSNNGDTCPGVFGMENGCPSGESDVDEPWNTIKVTTYDINGKEVAKSKSYFDALGKGVQSQSKDVKTGKTWASQTLYDSQGRPALQTLSAPTNSNIGLDFFYRENFIQKSNGNTLTTADFENNPENPTVVGTQDNTLGWYYSTNNTTEPYQDITDRPYSRTIYSDLNPGAALKTIGGNKIDNEWKNGYVFSMPAGQELSKAIAFGDSKYDTYKVIKTIARDVHGVENVVFTDTDGRTLAAARSDNESGNTTLRPSTVQISTQGFVDVHIPTGSTGIQINNTAGVAIDVYNLITEQIISTASASLPNGFYRVAIRDITSYTPNTVSVTYNENYYDYSLNEYDKTGRLLSSYQPLNKLKSEYQYNALGQLETTTSPDEGEAKFKYRQDGQIRFSQNSKQLAAGEFSYTNYDQRGRPVESGVLVNTNFATSDPDGDLPSGTTKEQHVTQYDHHDNTGLAAAFGSDTRQSNYAQQSFVAGNVAKTYTLNPETTTTWYSYDIYGRVQWIIQQINGLSGVKTIDYVYDPITSQVTKVYYQKGIAAEQFIHKYTYDADDYSLTKVETSTNDTSFTEHASYEYYETGGLKRTNIAQGLQGIDYVYNLQGALKSINHPSLAGTKDPGGDGNDLFGMIIDYHNQDYQRPLDHIKSPNYGVNQYNGNIKGIRWNSDYNPIPDKEHTYSYQYDRNNWLKRADYGHYNTTRSVEYVGGGTAAQDNITTTEIVNAGSTKNLLANVAITIEPGFHAKAGSSFSAKIDGTEVIVEAGEIAININGDYKVDGITYDANGNIQSLNRNKQTEGRSNVMDQLSYTYKTDKPNQLLRVDDAVTSATNADDIKDQDGDNYVYNSIGQLVQNTSENITYIYNASGLVTEVQKDNQPLVKFFYNDKGHRVRKESYNPSNGNLSYTEHYVRDAAGTAMAIYRDGQVIENTIYGASRLGVRKPDGTHLYQLTDHLGNVRAVVGRNPQGQAMAMNSATDYYPFGMPMPNRTLSGAEGYRYAYQGQEKDPETGKEAFELRLWDARIGRWLTTDPYGEFSSPYLGMGNNPIRLIDPDGGSTDDIYALGEDGSIELVLRTDDNYDILISEHNGSSIELRKGILDNSSSFLWPKFDRFGKRKGLETGTRYFLYDNWDNPKAFFEFVSDNTYVEWAHISTNSGAHYIGTSNHYSGTFHNLQIVNNSYITFNKFNDWRESNHSHPDNNWGKAHDLGLGFENANPSGFDPVTFNPNNNPGDRAQAHAFNTVYGINAKYHVYDVENEKYILYDNQKVHSVFHSSKKN